ncbi:MAG TPA: tetratricopeptide repeat protein [Caulobacter sp.]|nr:tetratricopeptide repeat protein [Caulobacter sp.]
MRRMVMAALAVLAMAVAGAASAQPMAPEVEATLKRHRADPVRAARDMGDLAEDGDPVAQWYYGMYLLNGDGVDRDEAAAWTWVERSARGGFSNGMISAAVMLATGQGVAEDDVAAREWYRKAAEQGSAHALRSLGMMMLTGEGGAVDPLRGYAYVEMASEGGDEHAGRLLQRMPPALSEDDRRSAEAIKVEWKRKFGDPG